MGKRILIVEDAEVTRRMIAGRLSAHGYEVLLAGDGEQALEVARRERPDLVLMDMSLPRLDGWEATRRLKAEPATSQVPVIALTSHALNGDRERTLAAGCDDYAAKPVDLPDLLARIRAWLPD